MRKPAALGWVLMLWLPLTEGWAEPRGSLRLESGVWWQTRNDVAVPGDTGSRFALDEVAGAGPYAFWRLEASWRLATRHGLRFLLAPLEIEERGRLDASVFFVDRNFGAGDVTATYRFNSYRATYRYRLLDNARWSTWTGFTLKIRDAEVALEQGGVRRSDTNVGLVPLLHLFAQYRLNGNWRLTADADGLAAPQGRAFDIGLRAERRVGGSGFAGLGYRTLEGGADNDSVYAFAWLHYAVVTVGYEFH